MEQRQNLKTVVRGAYDIQKLRIQMGNRIVGNFKAKLGQVAGEKEDELDPDGKEILKRLRACYDKLTDGVVGLKKITFEHDEIISSFTELCLVSQYLDLVKYEAAHFKSLGVILTEFLVFTDFLEGVKGVGPAMAGVIVSEIDISKARYPSSLWKYCGLDVATSWILQDVKQVCINATCKAPQLQFALELPAVDSDSGCTIEGGEIVGRYEEHDDPIRLPDCPRSHVSWTRHCIIVRLTVDGYQTDATYRMFHSGGRSRRKEHLVDAEYQDRDGKTQTRKSITFNPFLKTKMVSVLGGSFIKLRDSPYRKIYDDYKHRMESHTVYGLHNDKTKNDAGHQVTSKGRRHNMATRYMVKRFLCDLYVAWRTIEGLPVSPEYAEAKLGIKHRQVG